MKPLSRFFFSVGAPSLLVLVFCLIGPAEVAAQPFCSAPNLVDVTFAAGTRWRFCWEMRQREGLVINRAFYTARGTPEREVLFRASVAQVHVPYHPGSPRFRDLTISTSGLGAGALNLSVPECSPGTLLDPKVCRQIRDRGFAWKFSGLFQKGQEVIVWSSSQLGQYNYITEWIFMDDGTVVPRIGFTGRLQITGTDDGFEPFGQRINPEADPTPVFGVSHFHHVYWRFDTDIGGSSDNAIDNISTSQYFGPPPSPVSACLNFGECTTNSRFRFTNETFDGLFAPFTFWHVFNKGITNADGRNIGYEIVPEGNQHWDGMTDTDEPWSLADLYITTFNGCELLATDNEPPFIPAECAGAATNVLDMTAEGDNVDGADLVLWYVGHFQHVPRDEEEPNMLIEYQGVRLQPRSWRHINTLQP